MSEGPRPNHAEVSVRHGPLVGVVLGRVVGMLAARALCPVDRLDDALLITDALAAHAPDHTVDGHVTVSVTADDTSIVLAVAPLRAEGASGLLADSMLPGVGNVLEHMADEIIIGSTSDGDAEELVVRIAFSKAHARQEA